MKKTELTVKGTPLPNEDEANSLAPKPDLNDTSRPLKERIEDVIREIYDPEIPVNIYELGLIYDIQTDQSTGDVKIIMTLTSPACPAAQSLPLEVRSGVSRIADVNEVDVEITFDPQWTPENMSDAAKLKLGMF